MLGGAGIHFKLVGDETVGIHFRRAEEHASDLRTVWRRFARILANHNLHQFASEGSWGGHGWAPLNADYEARKVAHGFPPNPLMRTMRLFWSATSPRRLLRFIGRNRAEYVIDNPIYLFHHHGTRHMPARPIMVATQRLAGELARVTANHIVEPFGGV